MPIMPFVIMKLLDGVESCLANFKSVEYLGNNDTFINIAKLHRGCALDIPSRPTQLIQI